MINLGFFRRAKKEEDVEPNVDTTPVKSPEEIEKDRIQNELDYLKNEVSAKTEKLNSISQKLETVKEEYDKVVNDLMSSKKEWKEKKDEFESMKTDYEEISGKLSTTRNQLAEIKKQHEEIKADFAKFQEAKAQKNLPERAALGFLMLQGFFELLRRYETLFGKQFPQTYRHRHTYILPCKGISGWDKR